MSKKLKAVLADCRVLQIPFVDVDFPPVASSLGALSGAGAAAAPIPTVRWLRPFSARPLAPPPPPSSKAVELLPRLGEVVSGTLFGTGLSPLAQALRLLARVAPQRIRALFRNHVPNADGAVCVTLHEAGGGGSGGVRKRERNVVVDDLLPCDPRSEQPLCTATAGLDSVWPCVVEKALAKMHGSFAAAHTLSLAVVLEELCGAPATTEKLQQLHAMTPSESAELWATLSEAVARKRVVCVSTRVNSTAADEPLLLLDGAATAAAAAGETRLLRLRGDTVRNTAWGPNSSNWTPELRAKLGVAQQQQPDQQAESWVALEEFIGMIDSVTIVHGDTEWRYTTLPMRLVRPQSLVAIDIPMADGADVLFSIRQQTTAKTTPILGTRFCVVQKERPHKPFGGTNEAFVASVLHTTDRLHLPHGSFLGMLEVYRQHEAHLPATVELVVATTAKKPLSPKAVEYEGGKPPEWAFVLPEFSRKNGQCAACGNALAGTIFTVQSAKFHGLCSACAAVSSPPGLTGFFFGKTFALFARTVEQLWARPSSFATESSTAKHVAATPSKRRSEETLERGGRRGG